MRDYDALIAEGRAIAAEWNTGPGTAMYDFAYWGTIRMTRLMGEIDRTLCAMGDHDWNDLYRLGDILRMMIRDLLGDPK